MRRALLLPLSLAWACNAGAPSKGPTSAPSVAAASSSSSPAPSVAGAASSSAPSASASAPASPGCDALAPTDGDPAEPAPPALDCVVRRTARCEPPFPTTAAWQPGVFFACPRSRPRAAPGGVITTEALFSPRETRRAWCQRPEAHECCYVEYAATTCR